MRLTLQAFLLVAAVAVATPQRAPAVAINHWRFDEVSGLVAADTSGLQANNGIWQDAASTNLSWGPGLIGNAAILTGELGSSNVFSVGGIEADGATQLSYSVWVKPNLAQVGSGGDLDNKGVFTTGNLTALRSGGPTVNQFWGTTWKEEDKFRVDATGTYNSDALYDGTETEPEWIHVAFTWDGTAGDPSPGDEEVKTYINGQLVNTATRNVAEIIDDGNWQIGRDRTFAGRTFGGMIDDLVVWDQTLDETQIQAIYNGGINDHIDAITALSLSVGIPGDVNDNGSAGPEDFEIIRQNFGLNLAARNQGDLIDNDKIDFSDYGAWRDAVIADAEGAPVGAAAAPEPAAIALACALALGLVRRRT